MAKANDQVNDSFEDEMDFEPGIEEGEDLLPDITPEVDFEEHKQLSPAPATKNLPQTRPQSNSFDFNFDGLGDLPGVVVGDMGIEVSRLPVEKMKFTKDSRSLISIVSSKVVAVKVHYREGLGSYLCFGGKCCEVDGLASEIPVPNYRV